MEKMKLLQMASVFAASLILGRWFDQERKKAEASGKPWYAPWHSIPGILIIVILCVLITLAKLYK